MHLLLSTDRKLTGIYNFCNPGAISHNEVLDLYKKYVDPDYTYSNFTVEEQAKILKAGRSNNTLDHNKLVEALPDVKIPEIHESMEQVSDFKSVLLSQVYPPSDNLR